MIDLGALAALSLGLPMVAVGFALMVTYGVAWVYTRRPRRFERAFPDRRPGTASYHGRWCRDQEGWSLGADGEPGEPIRVVGELALPDEADGQLGVAFGYLTEIVTAVEEGPMRGSARSVWQLFVSHPNAARVGTFAPLEAWAKLRLLLSAGALLLGLALVGLARVR